MDERVCVDSQTLPKQVSAKSNKGIAQAHCLGFQSLHRNLTI